MNLVSVFMKEARGNISSLLPREAAGRHWLQRTGPQEALMKRAISCQVTGHLKTFKFTVYIGWKYWTLIESI